MVHPPIAPGAPLRQRIRFSIHPRYTAPAAPRNGGRAVSRPRRVTGIPSADRSVSRDTHVVVTPVRVSLHDLQDVTCVTHTVNVTTGHQLSIDDPNTVLDKPDAPPIETGLRRISALLTTNKRAKQPKNLPLVQYLLLGINKHGHGHRTDSRSGRHEVGLDKYMIIQRPHRTSGLPINGRVKDREKMLRRLTAATPDRIPVVPLNFHAHEIHGLAVAPSVFPLRKRT